ncbi:hypothetical protein KC340_g3768 [Hortaea werneckii]|nr:hypothetical protein KC342_g6718 [Hortaea werneckii]KAI7102379.1 hypothetical protein KC339_g6042 [Hortaea werneckii]KAI7237932.1 hypothetical protein KC365_g4592 [Hortaea werneckii]KAI7331590.1 hypothetical protein KC340_g3768 [Hortaea werneckii]KAI7367053.1 hypothetical protein KC354_g3715 [Hortaea werneckii]
MGVVKRFAKRLFSGQDTSDRRKKAEPTAQPEQSNQNDWQASYDTKGQAIPTHQQPPQHKQPLQHHGENQENQEASQQQALTPWRPSNSSDFDRYRPQPLTIRKNGSSTARPATRVPTGVAPVRSSPARHSRTPSARRSRMSPSRSRNHQAGHKASPSKLTIRRELMEQGDVFESMRGESDQQKTKRSNHKKKLSRLSRTASEWAVQLTSEYDYLMPSALSCKLEIEQVAQKQAELAEIMDRMGRIEARLKELRAQRISNNIEDASRIDEVADSAMSIRQSPRTKGHRIDRPLSSASRLTFGKRPGHSRSMKSADKFSSRSTSFDLNTLDSRTRPGNNRRQKSHDIFTSSRPMSIEFNGFELRTRPADYGRKMSNDMLSSGSGSTDVNTIDSCPRPAHYRRKHSNEKRSSVSIDLNAMDSNWVSYRPRRAPSNRGRRHTRFSSVETTRSSILFMEDTGASFATPMRIYNPTLKVVMNNSTDSSKQVSPAKSLQAQFDEQSSPDTMSRYEYRTPGGSADGLQGLIDTAPSLMPRYIQLGAAPTPMRHSRDLSLLSPQNTLSSYNTHYTQSSGDPFESHYRPETIIEQSSPMEESFNHAITDVTDLPDEDEVPPPSSAGRSSFFGRMLRPGRASTKAQPKRNTTESRKRGSLAATVFTKLNPKNKKAKLLRPNTNAGPRLSDSPPTTPIQQREWSSQASSDYGSQPSSKQIHRSSARSPSVLPGIAVARITPYEDEPLNSFTEDVLARTSSMAARRRTRPGSTMQLKRIEDMDTRTSWFNDLETTYPSDRSSISPCRETINFSHFSRPGRPSTASHTTEWTTW